MLYRVTAIFVGWAEILPCVGSKFKLRCQILADSVPGEMEPLNCGERFYPDWFGEFRTDDVRFHFPVGVPLAGGFLSFVVRVQEGDCFLIRRVAS